MRAARAHRGNRLTPKTSFRPRAARRSNGDDSETNVRGAAHDHASRASSISGGSRTHGSLDRLLTTVDEPISLNNNRRAGAFAARNRVVASARRTGARPPHWAHRLPRGHAVIDGWRLPPAPRGAVDLLVTKHDKLFPPESTTKAIFIRDGSGRESGPYRAGCRLPSACSPVGARPTSVLSM